MKIRFNKSYLEYICMVFVILINSLVLILVGDSKILFGIYLISNMCFLLPLCIRGTKEFNMRLAIFMMIFYSYFIEVYIHYLHMNVFIEAEFLYIIPLMATFIKSYNNKYLLPIISALLVIFLNFIISINYVSIAFYIKSIIPIVTFLLFYYSSKECNLENKKIYIFIFLVCLTLTLLQTAIGFNRDTRNGVFGVFGLNAYSFFIICYPIYTLTRYLKKEVKIIQLLISILITVGILICIENKAAIVMLFIIIFAVTIISGKFSVKKILITLMIPIVSLLSYKAMIKYYPFFSYLNNFDSIYKYFFENNDKINYKYGRYESLSIVYKNLDNITKLTGSGSGSSTPLDTVFFTELNRVNYTPHYIEIYGNNHGYHLTTISTIILDWGLFSLVLLVIIILLKIIKEAKNIASIKEKENNINYIKFAVLILLIFYFSYSNILVNYRTMAVIAILLGINNIMAKKGEIREQS